MSFALIPLLMLITFAVQDLAVGTYDFGQRFVFGSIVIVTALLGIAYLYAEFKREDATLRAKGFLNYFLHN